MLIEVDPVTISGDILIDEFTLDSVKLILTYDNGAVETKSLTEDMISSTDLAKLQETGNHNITVTYKGRQTSFFIYLVDIYDTNYLVTFKDYDGTILKMDDVNYGTSATPSNPPTLDGYTFMRWDKDYSNITDDLEVVAIFQSNEFFDLQGYTIKIYSYENDFDNYESRVDPFDESYTKYDKIAKQEAWNWVKETYNCNIELITSDFEPVDYYDGSNDIIIRLASNNRLFDLADWYHQYGDGFMSEFYIETGTKNGKLYTITDETPSINSVLYYNIDLLSRLGLEKTPAELFNEGNWTYTTFKEYCIAAQSALDNLPEASETNQFHTICGSLTDYWIGMTHAGGVKIADASTYTFQPLTPTAISAASTLRAMQEAGVRIPNNNFPVDFLDWSAGRGLFMNLSLENENNEDY